MAVLIADSSKWRQRNRWKAFSEGNDENDGTKEIDEGHENDAANEIDGGHENDEDEEAGEKNHGVDTEQGWMTFFE